MKDIIGGVLLILTGAAVAFLGSRPQPLILSRHFSSERSRKTFCTILGIFLAIGGAACIFLRGRAQ